MQIYVVQKEDTLDKIARMYNIPKVTLITSNEIENPSSLVPGQTLVIPIWGSYYFVRPGDSLFYIGRMNGVDPKTLASVNNIKPPYRLSVGQRLYIPQEKRILKHTGAYVDTDITGEDSFREVQETGDLLTTLQVFSYEVNRQGELTPPLFEESVIKAAYETKTAPLMVITNIENGQFSEEAATAIFNNEVIQEKLLTQVIQIMKEKGYRGLDIDFEYLGPMNREKYNAFLARARTLTSEAGFLLSTALAPKVEREQPGILYEGHDYSFHGRVTDFVFIMTYEWGWTGGPPRAVAPIDEVLRVMEYAVTEIPKDKIMMGIPLYGYDWKLPYIAGESRARAISSQQAISIASEYGAAISFDEKAMSPFFNYQDGDGTSHEVWFEDARSIQAKFDLVKRLGIRGFYYWVLGRPFPQNWLLLEDNFIVRTIV